MYKFVRCEDLLKLSFKISCSISLFCLYLMQARSIMERYLQIVIFSIHFFIFIS
ncbi:hypothetical protein ES319_A08G091800v1 [Gossypium barbadense]|uniref:Uncharacterized protein n=3 Tax=Gossypium TaxID=3633 RepID=A0A5J5UP57_GOSBA|nr:hypothetical protein ES319_A08G091800v1 [Gossypium barbadense]TYH05657.1 hypothetical protein ES288_A08G099400v1 [Gossypium darwinii]TYI14079.1 hypothetical protein ES332_A08G100700v1 [Gossypium tomentosum]